MITAEASGRAIFTNVLDLQLSFAHFVPTEYVLVDALRSIHYTSSNSSSSSTSNRSVIYRFRDRSYPLAIRWSQHTGVQLGDHSAGHERTAN
jgi:hypothetical protein